MRRRVSGRPSVRSVLLRVALAALLGPFCTLETDAAHGPAEHARSTGGAHSSPGEQTADLHAASCDGIKPASMGPLVSTAESRPVASVRLGRIWPRLPLGASSLAVPRPALFILHASLLI